MVSNQLVLAGLLALNVVLYAPLVVVAVRRRRHRVSASNLADAFSGLELALKEAVPNLPPGFTWEEAVALLRSSGVKVEAVDKALRDYEEYRYGGSPLADIDFREVVRIANMLGGISTTTTTTTSSGGGATGIGS